MIRKDDELGKSKKSSFKKFSDFNKEENSDAKVELIPDEDKDIPGNPNLPKNNTKTPQEHSTKSIKPQPQEEVNENKVKLYGKVAKLPKGTKASKGFNFLENVKISKNSIWYIMVEKCDNELQMVKYNYKKGVDLNRFAEDLKSYYSKKYQKNQDVIKLIEAIEVDGNDKYSWIKNIPLIEVDGKKMISKITEDLIKLLSK